MADPLEGKTILITGASSGIGEAMVRQLGDRAGRLILVARSEDRLRNLADSVNAATTVVVCDLTRPDAVDRVLEALGDLDVDVLVNNAGFGMAGWFHEADPERMLDMFRLNLHALVLLTHRLLPRMIERRDGIILNVGSTAGYQGCPFMAAYAATKSFVGSFSEALAWELKGTGVTASLLAPGTTRTAFFEAAGFDRGSLVQASQSAEAVARAGIRTLETRRRERISGWMNRTLVGMQRVLPRGVVGWFAYRILRPLGRSSPRPVEDPGRDVD
jgi:short-subunit dehydrogenase